MLCARDLFACFAPANAEYPSLPRMLAVAPVNIIVPLLLGSIRFATSFPTRNAPKAAISQVL